MVYKNLYIIIELSCNPCKYSLCSKHNMNILIEQTTVKPPFPSHVTTPAPNADVLPLSREIVSTSQDLNNVLTSAGNVHKFVMAHYVDTATGTYGIERLIASILTQNRSVFPNGIENSEFRKVAIASSMFVSEIIAIVQDTFGKDRYPYATVHSYLSYFMTKEGCKNKVARIKLTNAEDKDRPCNKPRTKFYLIEQTGE